MRLTASDIRTNQSGAALITALVFLVIMTMLALSSMQTNTLEEKMAANTQEINRAFQAADTAAEMTVADKDALNTRYVESANGSGNSNDYVATVTLGTGGPTATSDSVFLQETIPIRSAEASAQNVTAYHHFQLSGTGTTTGGVVSSSRAGAYSIGPPLGLSE